MRDALIKLTADMDRNPGIDLVTGLYFTRKAPIKPVIYSHLHWEKVDGKVDAGAGNYFDYPEGLIPIATILGAELAMTQLNLKSSRLRKLLCGKPEILIENGNILQKNLRKSRITLDELTGHLREKDVLDISTVQYAILETNGNLSVFPYPKERPASAMDAGISVRPQHLPVTIVEDGWLSEENLRKSGKDKNWLDKILRQNKTAAADVLLLTVDGENNVVFLRKEESS
mgnify:CR=1 FL=1